MRVLILALAIFVSSCMKTPDGTIVDTDRDRNIDYAVWLTDDAEPTPLIVLSHGSGGHYNNFEWLVTRLNDAGFAVAAVNHPNNTTRNDTPEGIARAWDRSVDISLLIDELLDDPALALRIDPEYIGAAGFSSGGYTVLSLAGARFDIDRMRNYCDGPERGRECVLVTALPESDPSASLSYQDRRISAIFSMAPAWGGATIPESLSEIRVPVTIIGMADDEILDLERHGVFFADRIPDAELVVYPEGGHFVFLTCSPIVRVADLFVDRFDLCGQAYDVDREALQEQTAEMAVQFFNRNFAG